MLFRSIKSGGKNLSLKNFLMALFLAFLLCVSLLYIYSRATIHSYQERDRMEFQNMGEMLAESADQMIQASVNVANTISYSAACQKFLLVDPPLEVLAAKREADDLISYTSKYSSFPQRFAILSYNGRKLSSGGDTTYIKIVEAARKQAGIPDDLVVKAPQFVWAEYEGQEYLVYLSPVLGNINGYRYRDNLMLYGWIFMPDDLESFFSGSEAAVGSCLAYEGRRYWEDDAFAPEEAETVFRFPMDTPGWELLRCNISVGQPMIFRVFQGVGPILVIIFAAVIMVILFTVTWLFSHSIKKIVTSIKEAETTKSVVSQPALVEIRPVVEEINRAFISLRKSELKEKTLLQERYEERLATVQTELMAYRTQINPHFLFNTLETARSMARHYKAGNLDELIGRLSEMFHYSLYSSMMTTLEKELDQIDRYLDIMEMRFPGRFQVEKEIEEDTLDWPVITMLLEPLIENITQHAFQGRPKGKIKIQTRIVEERLLVRIEDNGIGMPKEKLEEVIGYMKCRSSDTSMADSLKEQDRSIALGNIYRRLKLTFGDHAHLNIYSQENIGTVVEIKIPSCAGKTLSEALR